MNTENKLLTSLHANFKIENITLNNLTLNYVVGGQGDPLLLIHGANLGWGAWYKNLAFLSKHFRVYAIDLPGAGNSTKVDFHTANLDSLFVSTVDEFVKAKGLKNVTLLGHSMGGWIVAKLAIKNKAYLKKAILVDPVGFSSYLPPKFMPISIYPLAKLLVTTVLKPNRQNLLAFLEDAVENKTSISRLFIDYVYDSIHRRGALHPFLLVNRICSPMKLRKEFLFTKVDLNSIKKPTLIITGKKDKLIPYADILEKILWIPKGQVNIMESSGHAPFLEKSSIFNEIILQFITCK